MKILWANRYCLLDTSSGASRSAREILRRLAALGHEVRVVGATIFDAPSGVTGLGGAWDALRKSDKKISNVQDGNLTHQLVRTADTASTRMTLDELNSLYALYRSNLTEFSPDVVFFYGGNSFDMLIPLEARREGALTCAYLVNANYRGHRWYDDVDLVFTDSVATSRFYKEELGLDVTPIGKFIDPAAVVPAERTPERVTFINPSIEKGAALVAQLALHMEKTRPDITFEIVESRGNWGAMLEAVQKGTKKRKSLKNVVVTPNTTDMRPVFGRSRVLLVPSLWWESGARVLAEATLNGIPVIASDRGGNAEMIGDSGVKLQLPPEMYEPPYGQLLSEGAVNSLSKIVERLFDDEAYHAEQSQRSLAVGRSQHNCEANARAFERILLAASVIKKKRNDLRYASSSLDVTAPGIPVSSDAKTVIGSLTKSEAQKLAAGCKVYDIGAAQLTLVHPKDNWILTKIAQILNSSIENSLAVDFTNVAQPDIARRMNTPGNINYYIHYNFFNEPTRGIDVGFFTHIEENIPKLKDRYFSVFNSVDFAIFMCSKYFNELGSDKSKARVIIPGIDETYFSRKLVLGVSGRNYEYTDRKNNALMEYVKNLPFVDLVFTGGSLSESEMVNFYRTIDYVLVCSQIEGGPMSLLEGMASGKKVIMPHGVGLQSDFCDTVLSYDLNSKSSLEELLTDLHKSKMSVVAPVLQYTWDAFVSDHVDVFRSLKTK